MPTRPFATLPAPLFATWLLATACANRPLALDDDASSSGTESTESTESTATESSASQDGDGDWGGFVPSDDTPPPPFFCDPYTQNCPEGEKCVHSGEYTYEYTQCVPILGDQQTDEPCTFDGLPEATDDCVLGTFCLDPDWGDDDPAGQCVMYCPGGLDSPACPEGQSCKLLGQQGPAFCVEPCNPLVQDCGEGLGCYWANTGFECVFTVNDIPSGEPCGYINDCAPGNLCTDAAALPSCAGSACCTAYCDLLQGDAGCLAQPGTACVPFWDVDPPTGYPDLGVCLVPG